MFGWKCPSIDILHLLLSWSRLFCLSPFYWLLPSICLAAPFLEVGVSDREEMNVSVDGICMVLVWLKAPLG